jgi:tRNA pseudouridine55 synthase
LTPGFRAKGYCRQDPGDEFGALAYIKSMNGLVIIDKPSACTSHDVVNLWRRLSGSRRVGHLGTLDPMATGVLALAVGTATRLAQFYGKQEKTYDAEILFGFTSDTYDVEGEMVATGVAVPARETILLALDQFRGTIRQVPPPVSAKKIKGVPAYKLARRKEEVILEPVTVEIARLDVHAFAQVPQGETLSFTITGSAGTYIRSIAHDLGQVLGCGAVLSNLRRTAAGEFNLSCARKPDELRSLAEEGRLAEAVLPARTLLPQFPTAHIDDVMESQIRQGREFRTSPFVVKPGAPFVKAVSFSGELVAIGELKFPNVYHPAIVL